MKHVVLLALVLSSKVVFGEALVADNKQTRTIDCAKEPSVMIAGNENTVRLEGRCQAVRVPGNGNTVIVESAADLSLAGNGNTVAISGVDTISVPGDRNVVTWAKTLDGKREPAVSISGKNNWVIKK